MERGALDGERGLHGCCAGVFGCGRGEGLEGEVFVGGRGRGIGSVAASRAALLYVDPAEEEEKSDVEAVESRRIHNV